MLFHAKIKRNFNSSYIMTKFMKQHQKISQSPKIKTVQDEPIVISGPVVRLLTMLYDGMLILAMLFLMGLVLSVVGTLMFFEVGGSAADAKSLPVWYQNGVMTPAFVLTLVGFYGIFWRKSGQTLGMQTWRLKTVTRDGQLLTWGDSFKRIIGACAVPFLFALIGAMVNGSRLAILLSAFFGLMFNYVFCWFNRRGLSVHDILSNTMTLKVPKFEHEGLFASLRRKGLNK